MGLGIPEVIGDRREQIVALAQRPGVCNVRILGSVARGEAAPDSDIDVLVDGLENAAWGVIEKSLPGLKRVVEQMLTDLEEPKSEDN